LAVVEELLGDEAGVAQAGFQVLDQCFDALFFLEEFPAGLGEEDLGFPVLFRKALGLEVFISGVSAAAACPVRRDRVCWMLSWASCWQSCSKRWKLSMSSRRSRASSAVTLRVWLRPSCQIWNLK